MFFGAGQKPRGGGAILVSPDGLDWSVTYTDEREKSPKSRRIYDIAVGDSRLFAGGGNTSHGGDSCFFYSLDGRQWNEGSSFVTSDGATAITGAPHPSTAADVTASDRTSVARRPVSRTWRQ